MSPLKKHTKDLDTRLYILRIYIDPGCQQKKKKKLKTCRKNSMSVPIRTLTKICCEMCLGDSTLLFGGELTSLSDCCELLVYVPVDGFGNLKLVNMA